MAGPGNAYAVKKGVVVDGLKESQGCLVVPVMDETGTIHNLQFIRPDGSKTFLRHGRVEGCCYTIPGNEYLFICEGYSTGATIHQATGGTVICAFNAGNIPNVAKVVRHKCPTASITICADNDRFTACNPGVKFADQAAKAISAQVAVPVFDGVDGGDDEECKLTDFNDLCQCVGIDAVKEQIQAPRVRSKLPPICFDDMRFKDRVVKRPAPLEFIFRYNDQGLIPKGVVGVLTATGGTGKTFFLISLAVAGAKGGNFGPINAPKPIKTLIIVAEDTQDELDRRAWDTTRGQFPDNLYGFSVYGEIGPLMRLEGSEPVLADAYYWLDTTLSQCPGLELLILDPKSRLYGLDENNPEHATRWVQTLEGMAKRYDLTIIFSHHTSKENSGKISQNMSRGSSALVDGCRWQGGLIRMDNETAGRLGIDTPRQYILFDAPKSNYGADLPGQIIFRRGENGVLHWADPEEAHVQAMGEELLELLKLDPEQYTRRELIKLRAGAGIAKDMVGAFKGFVRSKDMGKAIDWLLRNGHLKTDLVNPGRNSKEVLVVNPHV